MWGRLEIFILVYYFNKENIKLEIWINFIYDWIDFNIMRMIWGSIIWLNLFSVCYFILFIF